MSAVPQKPRLEFRPARREHKRARIALAGPAGSGKTLSALLIASALGQRIAVIDAEHGSSECYAVNERGEGGIAFDLMELGSYEPLLYVEAIEAAAAGGYDVLIIDGLSPAWNGTGGALEQVDHIAARSQSNNKFFAWREVTPMHNALVEAMLDFPGHLIATLRVKTEYVIDDVEKDGHWQKVPRKLGLQPIQRDGLDYEFDIVGDLTLAHEFIVTKTRASRFDDNIILRPGVEFGEQVLAWLREGSARTERVRAVPAPKPERTEGYEGRSYERQAERGEPGPRHDARRARTSERPRHASDARRPPPPAPSAPRDTTRETKRDTSPPPSAAPTEPAFRFRDWGGNERWFGRPLREADANTLKSYAEAMHWAREAPKNRARLAAMQAHEEEVNAVLRAIYEHERAAAAQHDQRDGHESEPNGADPVG